ncbi:MULTISPECIES: alpha/beta fold hydrolase [Alphaproteobacteria]|uniref:Alpha/beta hydrolase n=2 Tax=Alphaproteobacteria TaxID=28211 RepID=A0A512HG94_9HYPH|nr:MULTISPECIES: alpha/beta hydrolase [Alphaproteobacteria]GEO84468.1 alpha/beta hydrolase [Ciceribacter naphthalenivorans]GLR22431.1 alpha/beta hydrolase [Ciceribacter naphthalenivorans]GLT05287.1 alpha/beta hydrolase [Sphingomonas psychrolutea]
MTAGYNEGFTERFVQTTDDLSLYVRIYGDELTGVPVVCLPGLTRNTRDFHQLAVLLSRGDTAFKVIAIDSRGRGRSGRDPDKSHYTLPIEAQDVVNVLDDLGIDRAAFIGTSRGGLILHLLAVSHPDRLAAVILNDIGPVIEKEGLKQIQAYLGHEQRPPTDLDEAATVLRAIHGSAFSALEPQDWRDLAQAIYREADGRIVADFDPAIAAHFVGADLEQPLPDLWQNFDALASTPLMAIRGDASRLLSPETLGEMAVRHPGMVSLTAKGQGHAPILHLDDIPTRIAGFLTTALN